MLSGKESAAAALPAGGVQPIFILSALMATITPMQNSPAYKENHKSMFLKALSERLLSAYFGALLS